MKLKNIIKWYDISDGQEDYSEFFFVVSLVTGIIFLAVTSYLYEAYLFNLSLHVIPKLQSNTSETAYKLLKFYSSVIGGGNF